MSGRLHLAAFAAYVAVATALTAQAAGPAETARCDDRDRVLRFLAARYGETVREAGLASGGLAVELIRRPDGGSWSLIVTSPAGRSCLVLAGEGWRAAPRGEAL